MIDTVVLVLLASSFQITDPTLFSPYVKTYPQFSSSGFVKCVQNPTIYDKRNDIYKPCLTHTVRIVGNTIRTTLAIQFSVPKLLYLNNLDEVTDKSFDLVLETLHQTLVQMGVSVHPTSLRLAPVSIVHYSKNIVLPIHITASMIMTQLAKIDVPKTFSMDSTRYKNAGNGIDMYSKSFEIVFYDKIKDLAKGSKVHFDQEPTHYQQSLFETYTTPQNPISILRLEVRIKSKQKLVQILKKCGQSSSPFFTNIFSEKISQAVLQNIWQQLVTGKNLAVLGWNHAIDLEIVAQNIPLTPQRLLSAYGAVQFAQTGGMRKLRAIMENRGSDRSWQRIKSDVELITSTAKVAQPSWVQHIYRALSQFEPYRTPKQNEQDHI